MQYTLSDEDRNILRAMIDDYRRRPKHAPRSRHRRSQFQTPDVFAASAPSGIPAATGSGSSVTPGSASCDIYRIVDDPVDVAAGRARGNRGAGAGGGRDTGRGRRGEDVGSLELRTTVARPRRVLGAAPVVVDHRSQDVPVLVGQSVLHGPLLRDDG